MVNSLILIYLLFLHFLTDFVIQSREMMRNKTEHLGYLSLHVLIQFLVFAAGLHLIEYGREVVMGFSIINAITHGIIHRYVWAAYKWSLIKRRSERKYARDGWFYTAIGFEQFLQVSVLIILATFIL